jgi:hypothetical protein
LSEIYCTPGPLNSNLIKIEKAVPNKPENNAKIKYKFPMSLALVENNHLSVLILIEEVKLVILMRDSSFDDGERVIINFFYIIVLHIFFYTINPNWVNN